MERKLYTKLLKEKNSKKISILIGPRQIGKTTLLKQIREEVSKKNKTLFLDLDVLSNFEKVSTFELLMNTLKLNGYEENQKDFFYLFLDEFQRYQDLSIIMKNVYDNTDNIKIYATGSSSLQIKNHIQESLAGRKQLHYIYPLDFEEFLWFKENKKAITQYSKISQLKGNSKVPLLKSLLDEFLVYGGYPAVVLENSKEEKKQILQNIFDLYVKKELVEYLAITKILGVKKLVEYLAINNGQKINFEEISSKCNLTTYELKQFIEILKETFILIELKPFFTNKTKELVKMPKIYFIDNGVRNYFIDNFNDISIRTDVGFLFEGYIISELLKNNQKNLKYWQNKQKQEVDLIVDNISRQTAIEIKYKTQLKHKDYLGLENFKELYPDTELNLVNLQIQNVENDVNLCLPYDLVNLIKFTK